MSTLLSLEIYFLVWIGFMRGMKYLEMSTNYDQIIEEVGAIFAIWGARMWDLKVFHNFTIIFLLKRIHSVLKLLFLIWLFFLLDDILQILEAKVFFLQRHLLFTSKYLNLFLAEFWLMIGLIYCLMSFILAKDPLV